ncbi:ANTAR domain-containing response regulator [Pseudomonas sp. Pseu.R1]|uniref:ANTAR domain-containing response regulator n=1 Tax=Pseudomonas sp. Pseu.R1 TaxID=3379818 RepID=UPI003B93078F
MKNTRLPNLRDHRVLILHKQDRDYEVLSGQLVRLGLNIIVPIEGQDVPWSDVDVCFFDANQAHKNTFPWADGEPQVPLIAMFSAETPERIHWSLTQRVCAFLVKPVRSSGTFLALQQAIYEFSARKLASAELDTLQERVKAKRIVVKAVVKLMAQANIDEDDAYDQLRKLSMTHQLSMEEMCLIFLQGESKTELTQLLQTRRR